MLLRKERTMRDNFGGIVTCNRLKTASCRIGFEKRFFPGLRVSRFGWERAHETGGGAITAGPEGIVHAPAEVSLFYQRLGIERYIMDVFRRKAPEVELWLTTTYYTYPGTLRVQKILYRIDAMRQRNSYGLYEAGIQIEDKISNPVISPDTKELMSPQAWIRALK
jgi:hypothetical protein